ncbi:OPT oligopeptide transporter protein-domain-containing protein [Kockiozyma suomiensis]|uniref:OPT oligopeptide transporter protein-domain-containing protein n=1 Tax=Kockiozyma suomiensis TaxID=1337062 RepID=UPI003343D4E7
MASKVPVTVSEITSESDLDFSGDAYHEKLAASVRARSLDFDIQSLDPRHRDQVVSRLKMMNGTGDTGDEDPFADRASHYLYEKLLETSLEDALEILRHAIEYHYGDVNFDDKTYERIKLLVEGPEAYGGDIESYELDARLEAVVIHYHSPYPEVRAVTDPFDDPTIPVETIRAYLIGSFWVAVGSFINEFFTFRQPTLSLKSTVIQLLVFPTGKAFQLLPDWGFSFRGTRYSVNPGPWSIKEQMLATIMVNVGSQSSNWMSMVVALKHPLFFDYKWVDFGFSWTMNFASLFFGYGLAGIMRKLVIFPVKAVFPNVLPTLALSRALVVKETKTSVHGWTISRQKLFYVIFSASFLYFFVPTFLFKALSVFNWMTWIAPKNKLLAMATGSYLGLGVNPLPTFDWAVINYGQPLVYPFYAFMNKFTGVLLTGIVMVILYWRNHRWTAFLPMNVNSIYDSSGKTYNLTRIMDENNKFSEELYENYSAPYMSAGNLVGTGGLWAVYTCTFVYVCISEHKLLWETLQMMWVSIRHPRRSALQEFDDPHSKLMSAYEEVPDWWYVALFFIGIGTGFAAIFAWPTTVPIWTVIAIFLFNIGMLMPTLVVLSRTGYSMGFGAFSVILAGYMDPGNPVTNIVIRMWGYNIDEQGESFVGDQKIAHYARIPQRATFRAQCLATLIQCFCSVGAVQALFSSVTDFCSPTQKDKFVCAFPRTVYSDAIMFGVIAPKRVLSDVYPALKNAFWIGAVIAVPFGLLRLKYRNRYKWFDLSLIGYGTIFWGSTYNLVYYIPGCYFSWFFMYYVRKRYIAWWTKYNYILTSGLSAGIAFGGVIIFAALQYPQVSLPWWGNSVYAAGADFARVAALKDIPEEGFGLPLGSFH